MAAIGVGLPLAMGAAIGHPGGPVLLIVDDSGFVYNLAELATCVQEKLPVVTTAPPADAVPASLIPSS